MGQVKAILQINTRDQRGGTEHVARRLFQKYLERGLQSWMLVGKKYSREKNVWEISHAASAQAYWSRQCLRFIESLSPLRQQYRIRGIAAIQARLRLLAQPRAWRRKRAGYEDFSYPGTWNLLDQVPQRPDIIHCHNLHSNYFDLRALPWLSQQAPLILHLHDTWLLTGHCAHNLDCERWRSGCGNCPYLNTYPAIPHDKSAENWRHKQAIYTESHLYIVAVSHWLMAQVQKSMLLPVKGRVIHNGIDLTVFKPGSKKAARQELGLPLTARVVLYSAHNRMFKDSEAMQKTLQLLTGMDLYFVCIGAQGPTKELGNGCLIQTGYIDGAAKMAQYYRAADLYLHAAQADSFPTAILEALAVGTPVVATAVGGIPEQIIDGQTGYLVPQNSLEALVYAVQTLIDDNDLRIKMGAAAAQYARQHFGIESQIDTLLEWYEEVRADWQARPLMKPSLNQKNSS